MGKITSLVAQTVNTEQLQHYIACFRYIIVHTLYTGDKKNNNWRWNNRSEKSGITSQISCDKNTANSNGQQLQTLYIISSCPILATEQYIKIYDGVCTELHFNICKKIGVELDNKHWHDFVPKSVKTNQEGRLPYCGTNRYETTEPFLTINRTS